jgi:hypothetical protein
MMKGDVATSVPPSTKIDMTTPTSQHKINVGPSSGKQAMTFSCKRGEEFDAR